MKRSIFIAVITIGMFICNGANAQTLAYDTALVASGTLNDVESSAVVYPNPVLSNAHIILNTLPASPVIVDVIDMNGNEVRSYRYAAGTYDLDVSMTRLPVGIYSVRVYGKDVRFQNLKIVKQ